MTAFILVSGTYTGGWIWREVTARLRESGAEAYPATLTGMGERRHLAGPGTDLESHIEDLVQLIDHVDAPEVVMVGHCYGIHPVLGAVGRRPERIARIVYVDAGMPQDGDAALELVPDRVVRDRLSDPTGQGEVDWRIPRRHWTSGSAGAVSTASPQTHWHGWPALPHRSRVARSPSRSDCRMRLPSCRRPASSAPAMGRASRWSRAW